MISGPGKLFRKIYGSNEVRTADKNNKWDGGIKAFEKVF